MKDDEIEEKEYWMNRRCGKCEFLEKEKCKGEKPICHSTLCKCPKNVPNDVYKFRIYLRIEMDDISIYTDPDKFTEESVQEAYFTKERIEELKEKIINKIKETENPFNIYCNDTDGNYIVSDNEIFRP